MRFVLWGTYCSNALEARTPYREQHLAGLRRQKEDGILITLGPTETTSHVFGIYVNKRPLHICCSRTFPSVPLQPKRSRRHGPASPVSPHLQS